MAAAFLILALFVVGALAGSWVLAAQGRRSERRWIAIPSLLPLILCVGLAGYLVTKVIYEEIYPCWFVDELYCDYGSTQYHNLFGWEF